MSKKVINEVVEDAEFEEIKNEVEADAEAKKEEIVVPEEAEEKESFKEKFKRTAPKIAKVVGIGALAVASFVLGAKSAKKNNSDDGDCIDTDYTFPNETFDTNDVTTEDTTNE